MGWVGTESEKRRSGRPAHAHALAQTDRGSEGERETGTQEEEYEPKTKSGVGKKGAGEEVAMGGGTAPAANSLATTTSTASSVSFGHVRCADGPILYQYFPVPKPRRSEAPSSGLCSASEEEINARSKNPRRLFPSLINQLR
jgi:hypothetical protein